ncbi:hypothetical protein [Ferrovibrio sp.]|uniref:hypothetical protein n=1 Tax=Ferrovibrio sp. TaxID=1917215 RepID=UPI0035B429BE
MSKPSAPKPAAKSPGLLKRLAGALFIADKPPADKKAGAKKAATTESRRDPRIELARLIKSIRAKLDPNLLRIAEKLARKGPPTTDHERAMLSVELFLAQRQDGGRFAEKLRERLQREKGTRH